MMERAVGIILPHQLFADNPLFAAVSRLYLLEHPYFFTSQSFHKKKLLFHRASMKAYEHRLIQKGKRVAYIEFHHGVTLPLLTDRLKKEGVEKICIVDPVEHAIGLELEEIRTKGRIEVQILETPLFLTSREAVLHLVGEKEHFSMASFYIRQRKRLGILIEDGKPVAGQWSFDPQNRRRLPKQAQIPNVPKPRVNKHLKEAKSYVEQHFSGNPGDTENWIYPVTHEQAREWCTEFLEKRLSLFGPYEDAISRNHAVLFHSVLSPLLNAGLLTPAELIHQVLEYGSVHGIDITSIEGFVRQVIGWREFIRGVYLRIGEQQKKTNFWGFTYPLSQCFYDGSTGIEPVDTIIRRVLGTAYAHHIERLMVLGNFMLLCEIHPDHVYRWFMELFIDAYDWVMVPNLYGMSQYADGGQITTKPYISSSNYIRNMSDWRQGDWSQIWDGLFWRFIHRHKSVFTANPRMHMMTLQLERMDPSRLKVHLDTAERFLGRLYSGESPHDG
ncbi:MAG: cryptochrome/photolyase family protein [Sedimentisphaerales bacterium]|nr:cryptochrome/photolyase family protein [Sedimentisphaerales bacterium]